MSTLIGRVPRLWPLLRPLTRRFWERRAQGWDERIGSERPERVAPLVAACDELETEPEEVLELGAGTGVGAFALAQRFPRAKVVGVDLSQTMVETARAKVPRELADRLSFTVADAGELPYVDQTFGLVAQLNLPVYFDEVVRVLRPGGHVIVASSFGPATPYYTPHEQLTRGFSRRGIEVVRSQAAGGGDFFLGRRSAN